MNSTEKTERDALEQKDKMLQETVHMLTQTGISIEEIARKLSLSPQEVKNLI